MSEGPTGFVVTVDAGDRIHFHDWAADVGPADQGREDRPGVLLIHGLSQTAWIWAPVARELARQRPVVAMDLRGHGLSDAPTEDGSYDLAVLADDAVAVVDGSGLLEGDRSAVVLAGHGFGGIVATMAAVALGSRCAGLVLVDGGWESIGSSLDMDADEFLRGVDEPPEVMRSMSAFLADRRGFDPASWDADQEAAAVATVVETHAGRVVPVTRPHALEGCVRSMFRHEPADSLAAVTAPIVALVAGGDDDPRARSLATVSDRLAALGRPPIRQVRVGPVGHNLMRYRPSEVVSAITSVAVGDIEPPSAPPSMPIT